MTATDPLVRNHVTVCGDPKAVRTLVLSHGFGTDQNVWSAIVDALGKRFRIVLFDHVGQGNAPQEAFVQHRYLTLENYAHDLIEVCTALKVKDAIAVGHSMGAMVCLLASVRKPELFSRLVLISASPRYLDDLGYHGGMSKDDYAGVYRAIHENYSDWVSAYAPKMMGDGHPEHFGKAFAASLAAIPPENALTIACSVLQSDYRTELPKVQAPTLIIQPNADLAVPLEVVNYLHRHIAGSELRVIDASGHLPHITSPAAVLRAMEAFLA
jgi:sigma-B regulation protein RsbQ